jgi:2-dehydropantoate 2-reductase
MRIAILGSGAMGALFGGYLSKKNDVTVIDVSQPIVDAINEHGVRIREKDGSVVVYHPKATTDASSEKPVDLIIVFVKSMSTISALRSNIHLIGKDTYLMTLQNGAGHESKLLQFADKDHVIIGSTQHNSSVIEPGFVNHGGIGKSSVGLLSGNNKFITALAENMTSCGFECEISDNIQWQIWNKMFTNTAASSLTAIFQVPLGFIAENKNANTIMRRLVKEAVEVANTLGLGFDLEKITNDVQQVCENAPNGYTSIYADIRDGRRSEVDTISGSVVEAAKDLGISVPYHEMVVQIIHAMEGKGGKK